MGKETPKKHIRVLSVDQYNYCDFFKTLMSNNKDNLATQDFFLKEVLNSQLTHDLSSCKHINNF